MRHWDGCRSGIIFLLGMSLGGAVAPLLADNVMRGIALFGATARPISRATYDSAERF